MRPEGADPYGLPAAFLARVCGVDLSTARRWKRSSLIPARYGPLLELAAGGDLGALCAAWRGWRLVSDELVNPEGERFGVDQVRALRLTAQLAGELDRQLRRVLVSVPMPQPRELIVRVRLEPELGGARVSAVAHFAAD